MQAVILASSRALLRLGVRSEIRTAMMATTTRSSTNVKESSQNLLKKSDLHLSTEGLAVLQRLLPDIFNVPLNSLPRAVLRLKITDFSTIVEWEGRVIA